MREEKFVAASYVIDCLLQKGKVRDENMEILLVTNHPYTFSKEKGEANRDGVGQRNEKVKRKSLKY
ncbi:unnamed protein product [Meloidogyne enterolobii]|uniref:Uncharacterized protein n=1 Tax=Meloidogyne enterolobii TaxID=390850 RepID=A0ACB0XNS5_MELEN